MRAAAVLLAMMVACGDADEVTSTSTTSSTSSTTTPSTTSTTISSTSTSKADDGFALTKSCTHEARDVRIVVSYPGEWHVNGEGAPTCSAFDPEPVNLRQGTEFPLDIAVVVRVEPVAFATAAQLPGLRVEDQRRQQVDGRDAVRLDGASTDGPTAPQGQRSVRYIVDAGEERSIIATTWDVEGNDFESGEAVLDRMVESFDIEPRAR